MKKLLTFVCITSKLGIDRVERELCDFKPRLFVG